MFLDKFGVELHKQSYPLLCGILPTQSSKIAKNHNWVILSIFQQEFSEFSSMIDGSPNCVCTKFQLSKTSQSKNMALFQNVQHICLLHYKVIFFVGSVMCIWRQFRHSRSWHHHPLVIDTTTLMWFSATAGLFFVHWLLIRAQTIV